MLDHWLDWPSNYCPPVKGTEKNFICDSSHQKEFKTKDATFNAGSILEQCSSYTGRHFLSTLISAQPSLSSETVSTSSLSSALCGCNANSVVDSAEFCRACEGCRLFTNISSSYGGEEVSDTFILEQLASHVGQHIQDETDSLSKIRKYFAAKGCDIINYQDSEGKTLLHYSIIGMNKY